MTLWRLAVGPASCCDVVLHSARFRYCWSSQLYDALYSRRSANGALFDHLGRLVSLLEAGKIKVVIDSKYSVDDVSKAYARVDSARAVGKVVVEFSD